VWPGEVDRDPSVLHATRDGDLGRGDLNYQAVATPGVSLVRPGQTWKPSLRPMRSPEVNFQVTV
jgi:hypothetical protein